MPVETSQFHVPNERHQAVRERDSSKPTILIVEDEAGPREALKLILRPFYNLHSVDSAEAEREGCCGAICRDSYLFSWRAALSCLEQCPHALGDQL